MEQFYPYPFLNSADWGSLKLEILENALFTGDRSWYHPHMTSPFNRIYFIISGQVRLENEQGTWDLLPGHMYLIPAGSRYTYMCTDVIHKFYVHFNMELFPGTDLFSRFDSFQVLPYSPELLDTILSEAKKESLTGLLHLKAIFWKIVFDFFLAGTDGSDYMELFKGFYRQEEVLHYLSSHLCATLRIQDLSDALHIPAHQLSRSFRQDTGQGLKEYMEQMLMQKAKHLLLRTSIPIYEISETLGFSDPFYFSRFFKKMEGASPRDYRKLQF